LIVVLLFFVQVLQSLSGILSLTSRRSFGPCSGFPNHECEGFAILTRVIILINVLVSMLQLKEKLGKNLPLIACHAAGIIGQDVASGEHMEVSWPQPGAGMSKTLSRRIVSRQNGLVLTVGRVPGLHVQALSLCNSCGVSLFHLLTFILYQGSCINCMLCVTNMFNMQEVY
jgi:hypothetical protein